MISVLQSMTTECTEIEHLCNYTSFRIRICSCQENL